jgi:bacterial/archaeal transporter family protein
MAAATWQVWPLPSAVFAALTAILGKVGVEDVDPDVAPFIRPLMRCRLLTLTRRR